MPIKASNKPSPGDKRVGFIVVIITIIVIVIAMFVASARTGMSFGENIIGAIITPVQGFIKSSIQNTGTFLRNFNYDRELELEYNKLRHRLESAEINLSMYNELKLENERLKSLMNASEKYQEFDPIYSKVIGKDPGNWFDIFTIDKGSNSGIRVDMAVINIDGLVGRVVQVGATFSKVLSVVDGNSAIGGIIERTRDNGIVYGMLSDPSAAELNRMYYLPTVNDVMPGDRVLTSGLEGKFPSGIPLGEVREVSRQPESMRQYVTVEPLVDFLHLEEVLVLRFIAEDESNDYYTNEDDLQQSILDENKTKNQQILPTQQPDNNIVATPTPTIKPDVPNAIQKEQPEDTWAKPIGG